MFAQCLKNHELYVTKHDITHPVIAQAMTEVP